MKLKLLRCIGSVDPTAGGIIEAVLQSSRAIKSMGGEVEILSLDLSKSNYVRQFPFSLHALGSGEGGYGYTPKLVPWLKANQSRFNAVIIEGIWQYHSFGAWRALRLSGTPYFVFSHGMLDPWFKRAYRLKHLKKSIYWRLAEHRVLRDAHRVVFTCEEERALARKSFRPYRCQDAVMSLGISSPGGDATEQRKLYLEKFPHLKDKQILLFLGRLHEKKGCDLLIKAFSEMAGVIDRPTELVMAGPSAEPKYQEYLRGLFVTRDGDWLSISFPGMLTGDVKWGAYHAASAFILPSHQENFGIAVIEALACGVPILMSDKVNIWREILEDGACLIESDDLIGTRKLLERWQRMTPAQREAMREAARVCFLSRFEIKQSADKLLKLIGTALPRT